MAKPDTEDGWIPYAHELDAALAAADFKKGARIVLRDVFAQIFGIGRVGKARLQPAVISPSDLAQRTGLTKREVVRSLHDLVLCRVLKRIDRGTYSFLKDYECWIWPDGSPRLSKVELAWCASEKRAGKDRKEGQKGAQIPGVQIDPKTETLGAQIDPAWGSELTPLGGLNCPQNDELHSRNGRAELEIRDDRSIERAGEKLPGDIQTLVAQVAELFTPAIVKVVRDNAADIHKTLGSRTDYYLAALKKARASRKPIADLHAFCIVVAKRYLAEGLPADPYRLEPEPESKPKAALHPAYEVKRADPELVRALEAQTKKPAK